MKLTNYLKTSLCLAGVAVMVGCASPGTTYTRSTGRAIDDKATTARIKSTLAKDSLVKATEIDVSTFRGNVHLTGFVDHPVQKDRATQIIRNVEGVEWFKNDIIVKTELPNMRENAASGQPMREPSGAERDRDARSGSQNGGSQGAGSPGAGWQKGSGSIDAAPGVERSVKSGKAVENRD